MGEESLCTLKEIAAELGMNYRTVIDYKNNFSDFIKPDLDGDRVRYSKSYKDFFRLINTLKHDDYSVPVIRRLLTGQVGLPARKDLRDWILVWMDDSIHPSTDGHIHPSTDGCIHPNTDGHIHPNADENIHPDVADDIPGDKGELSFEDRLAQLREGLLEELGAFCRQQEGVSVEINQVEHGLADLCSQANAALTQIYKAVNQLQDGLSAIDQRLQRLERDLGVDEPGHLQLEELDLTGMQISAPQLLEVLEPGEDEVEGPSLYAHANLDFVRASIQGGKPDRDAVAQWIHAEKEIAPDISYGELAEKLDEAGIPTLRGLDGWNRGVVRNLAMRGNGRG